MDVVLVAFKTKYNMKTFDLISNFLTIIFLFYLGTCLIVYTENLPSFYYVIGGIYLVICGLNESLDFIIKLFPPKTNLKDVQETFEKDNGDLFKE